jgi:hypothetical protein
METRCCDIENEPKEGNSWPGQANLQLELVTTSVRAHDDERNVRKHPAQRIGGAAYVARNVIKSGMRQQKRVLGWNEASELSDVSER